MTTNKNTIATRLPPKRRPNKTKYSHPAPKNSDPVPPKRGTPRGIIPIPLSTFLFPKVPPNPIRNVPGRYAATKPCENHVSATPPTHPIRVYGLKQRKNQYDIFRNVSETRLKLRARKMTQTSTIASRLFQKCSHTG